jgi:hypothetical protein
LLTPIDICDAPVVVKPLCASRPAGNKKSCPKQKTSSCLDAVFWNIALLPFFIPTLYAIDKSSRLLNIKV